MIYTSMFYHLKNSLIDQSASLIRLLYNASKSIIIRMSISAYLRFYVHVSVAVELTVCIGCVAVVSDVDSLRPSDPYMRQWTNHHWFR